jgi:hypothetical protein
MHNQNKNKNYFQKNLIAMIKTRKTTKTKNNTSSANQSQIAAD